jgi:hypothetical protein
MNTNIPARNGRATLSSARRDGANDPLQPNAALPSAAPKLPPGPEVRALCAALLSAPIRLGSLLAISVQQSNSVQVRSALFRFVQDKIFFPQKSSSETHLSLFQH